MLAALPADVGNPIGQPPAQTHRDNPHRTRHTYRPQSGSTSSGYSDCGRSRRHRRRDNRWPDPRGRRHFQYRRSECLHSWRFAAPSAASPAVWAGYFAASSLGGKPSSQFGCFADLRHRALSIMHRQPQKIGAGFCDHLCFCCHHGVVQGIPGTSSRLAARRTHSAKANLRT
jgi:hypothetical protein